MPRSKSTKLADVTEIEREEETQSVQENELVDFLDGLGPAGIAEVSLYRFLANGKQRFITSGPPAQFSEQYVQSTYGSGDYLVRSRLNGKWYRSKTFSVEGVNGNGGGPVAGPDSELERLKLRLQETELRMEADRNQSAQRNHDMMLALIEGRTATPGSSTIGDIITAVKSLKEMSSGQDEVYKSVERLFGLSARLNELKNGGSTGGEGGGWWDWLKPVAAQVGTAMLPKVLPFLNGAGPTLPTAPVPTPASAPNPPDTPATAAPATLPELAPAAVVPEANSMSDEQAQAAYLAQKRDALLFALSMARMNRPAEVWVDLAIEQVETSGNPIMSRFMDEIVKAESFDAWFAELQKLEPSVITQRGWFELFFQAMRDSLTAKAGEPAEE